MKRSSRFNPNFQWGQLQHGSSGSSIVCDLVLVRFGKESEGRTKRARESGYRLLCCPPLSRRTRSRGVQVGNRLLSSVDFRCGCCCGPCKGLACHLNAGYGESHRDRCIGANSGILAVGECCGEGRCVCEADDGRGLLGSTYWRGPVGTLESLAAITLWAVRWTPKHKGLAAFPCLSLSSQSNARFEGWCGAGGSLCGTHCAPPAAGKDRNMH